MRFNSYGLIIILSAVGVFFFSSNAFAATLSIITAQETYQVGDQFNADIKIDSQDVGVNAGQATIKFSPAVLEVVEIDKTSSVFNFWIQDPSFDNNKGEINFVGGASSGLVGKTLQVVRIVFKAKGIGDSDFVFSDGAITASDGSGTNVLSVMNKGKVTVGSQTTTTATPTPTIERAPVTSDAAPVRPVIRVPLYPNPISWYNDSSRFTATWQIPENVNSVATELNRNSSTNPSTSAGLFTNQTFSALSDGVWYLHVRFYNNIGWSPTSHYRIGIDTVPPSTFDITFSDGFADGFSSSNPSPTVSYGAKDQLSGIDHYTIQVDSSEKIETNASTYTLPAQKPGKHMLKVGAQDRAGNKTESMVQFEVLPIDSPKIFSTSPEVFTGEGRLVVNGSSLPNVSILLDIRDWRNNSVYNVTTDSNDKGFWAIKIDSPLRTGKYYILVSAQDSRGASSLPVRSEDVIARERPVMVLWGFNITYLQLVILLILILAGSYATGWYTNSLMHRQTARRILISQRDVSSSFNVIKRDIEKAIKNWDDGKIEGYELTQIEYLLRHINEKIDNLQKYIINGINDIGKK